MGMRDVQAAVRAEYAKLGRLVPFLDDASRSAEPSRASKKC
ncbi:MAG: hypothetical protein ACYCU6_05585 [Acidimicrobiales bacterium]